MAKQKTTVTPEAKKTRETKTNHQTGWHKRIVNPTTNYAKSTHKEFCRKCLAHNQGCPSNGQPWPDKTCDI